MWTATIIKKDFTEGQLRVIVLFTDSGNSFEETYFLRTGEELDSLIQGRIDHAEKLSIFELSLGTYTTPEKTAPIVNEKDAAIFKLRQLKDLVLLGALKEDDKQVLDAIASVKATL